MTTFVDAVKISGVKAISGTINLDLRSPLVVIYAPNGTGKTSVWHAISAVIADFREEHLQCKVSGAETLNIVANIRTKNGSYEATRHADQRLRLQQRNSAPVAGTEALRLIAPECNLEGMQTRGTAIQSRLQDYIRSTRTLPSDSLAYLIDDNEASIALRRQIFADLTGTSGLQVEQRELTTYIKKLTEWRDEQSRERAIRVADHTAQQAASSGEIADTGKILAEAAAVLELDASEITNGDMLPLLRSKFSSRAADFELRQKRMHELRDTVAQQSALGSVESLKSELLQTTEVMEKAQASLSSAASEIQQQHTNVVTARAALSGLDNFLLHAEDKLSAILGRADVSHSSTIGEVARRTNSISRSQLEAGVLRVAQKISDTQAYESLHSVRDRLAKSISEVLDAAAQVGDPNEFAVRLRHVETEIAAQLANNAQLDALKIQLTDTARRVLVLAPASTCPCCAHQWPSNEALTDAIEAVQKQGQGNSDRINTLQVERDVLAEKIKKSDHLQNELSQLTLKMNSASQRIEALQVQLNQSQDLPANLSELTTLLEAEKSKVLLSELLELVDDLGDALDQSTPLGSVLRNVRAQKQDIESGLIKLRADLDVIRGEERRLQTLLDESRKSNSVIEQRINAYTAMDARRKYLISTLELSTDLTKELLSWQEYALREEKALVHVRELLNQATESLGSAKARKLADDLMTEIQRIQGDISKVDAELSRARDLLKFIQDNESNIGEAFFKKLGPAIATLFSHMQVNKIFSEINITTAQQSFSLTGSLDKAAALSPDYFSHGQQQDLALAMFLARACTLGGSYFLDEPLLHLDDLNRTALLDCIRACVIGTHATDKQVKLLITTANWSVARQFIQKFSNVKIESATPALTVYSLTGNVNIGVRCERLFPGDAPLLQ